MDISDDWCRRLTARRGSVGLTLAAGNMGGDYHADLAIGVPAQDVNGIVDVGVVSFLLGSSGGDGLSADGSRILQISAAGKDKAYAGWALSAAEFGGGSRYVDLAIGIPQWKTLAGAFGLVSVRYGDTYGPSTTFSYTSIYPLPNTVQELARFGKSLSK